METLKIFFFGTNGPMALKLGMCHWILDFFQYCKNVALWLTILLKGQILENAGTRLHGKF